MIENPIGRSQKIAPIEHAAHAQHAALLVDFDNVTMGIRSDLQNQLRKLLSSDMFGGKVSVQRAYADWRRYPQYIVPLTEASIDLIFAPAVGANKKNATDIRLAIDALELVFTRPEIGTYILLSGDSDFSALVLKLKEYGKYVIGVGIRESSSDLLVQNCDEYYSYNELTGLAKAGEVEHHRRDPWELVVEAVEKMTRDGDVMRSDRLKQVMQGIDPNFNEKDVGCNRFGKFVVEAAQRGLLELTKMENGQFAIDLGPNANVATDSQPDSKETATKSETTAPTTSRRRKSGRARAETASKPRSLTLAEGFDLLRRSLLADESSVENGISAEKARAGMIKIHGSESDAIFESKRFQRMLRQANDADLIELIKDEGDDYRLKLSAASVAQGKALQGKTEPGDPAEEIQSTSESDGAVPEDVADEKASKPKRSTRKKTTKAKKTTRARSRTAKEQVEAVEPSEGDESISAESTPPDDTVAPARKKRVTKKKTTKKTTKKTRSRTAAKETKEELEASDSTSDDLPDSDSEVKPKRKTTRKKTTARKSTRRKTKTEEATESETSAAAVESPTKDSKGTKAKESDPSKTKRSPNPRYRRGSRSAPPRPKANTEGEEPKKAEAVSEPQFVVSKTAPRSLGARVGSRGAKRKPATKTEEPAISETATKEKKAVQPAQPEAKELKKSVEKKELEAKVEQNNGDEEEGLFSKVTAAFQRAIGAAKERDDT